MKRLTRNTIGVFLTYIALVAGFALWQRQQIDTARRASSTTASQDVMVLDDTMSRIGWVALGALAVVGGLGSACYLLLVQRGRQVTDLLQGALAGRALPAPR